MRIWVLKNSGFQEANILGNYALQQAVRKTLGIANIKIGYALKETAEINKINIKAVNADKGFLKGYSTHFKTEVFITFSAKNGGQVWCKEKQL